MPNDPIAPELNELASELETEFREYCPPDGFSELVSVVETEKKDRPTLIVYLEMENASTIADEVETFLQQRGARTERETYPDEIRVLAVVD